MGTYYSSVETRLQNALTALGLTLEDLEVLDPRLLLRERNVGRLSIEAACSQLRAQGKTPGTWNDASIPVYKRMEYYLAHREEIRAAYRNAAPPVQPEPVDWEAFRRATAQRLAVELVKVQPSIQSVKIKDGYPVREPYPDADTLAHYAVQIVDALVRYLKPQPEAKPFDGLDK